MSDRIEIALWHAGFAMKLLPLMSGGWGALSGSVATVFLSSLGPNERSFLAAAAVQACNVEFQASIEKALRADELRRHWGRQEWEQHEWQMQRCAEAEADMEADRLKWGTPPRWVADGSLLEEKNAEVAA